MSSPQLDENASVLYICGQMSEKVDNVEDRLKTLEKQLAEQSGSLREIERKVFNGFDEKIDALNEKIDENKVSNEAAHAEVKKALGGIIRFGAASLILIFVTLLGILGSIWLRERGSQAVIQGTEVQVDAPGDSSYGDTN